VKKVRKVKRRVKKEVIKNDKLKRPFSFEGPFLMN